MFLGTLGEAPAGPAIHAGPNRVALASAVRTIEYGRSVEGRPLLAKIYGNGGPTTFLLFTFHGDERQVYPIGQRLEAELDRTPELFADRRVVLVLQVNPDGWAKGTRQNANGVDLNRNYSIGWKANKPGSRYYSGPNALSEPETQALVTLIESFGPSQIVSVHQPFDWVDPDGEQSMPLAQAMMAANGMHLPDRPQKATPGSFGKYCSAKGIAIVTLEMPKNNPKRLDEYWEINRPGFLAAIQFAK